MNGKRKARWDENIAEVKPRVKKKENLVWIWNRDNPVVRNCHLGKDLAERQSP